MWRFTFASPMGNSCSGIIPYDARPWHQRERVCSGCGASACLVDGIDLGEFENGDLPDHRCRCTARLVRAISEVEGTPTDLLFVFVQRNRLSTTNLRELGRRLIEFADTGTATAADADISDSDGHDGGSDRIGFASHIE
jgi:hypothetical protein